MAMSMLAAKQIKDGIKVQLNKADQYRSVTKMISDKKRNPSNAND